MFGDGRSRPADERPRMEQDSQDAVEPVTTEHHDTSWSANLEQPHHADDRGLLVGQALDAVEHTAAGTHVNLVTHADHGHPGEYLYEALEDRFGDSVAVEYVDQCGCGGHVVRVHVEP
jgi:putative CGCGG family rSAM target protein